VTYCFGISESAALKNRRGNEESPDWTADLSSKSFRSGRGDESQHDVLDQIFEQFMLFVAIESDLEGLYGFCLRPIERQVPDFRTSMGANTEAHELGEGERVFVDRRLANRREQLVRFSKVSLPLCD
jgi:hypothetical protein